MLKKYDYHMHTNASYDADGEIITMIETAINIGYKEIAITEHLELDFDPKDILDYNKYIKNFKIIQEKYKNEIKLVLGCELGFTKETIHRMKEYLEPYDFDFVILSIHSMFSSNDIYFNDFFKGKTKEESYNEYFETMIEYCETIDYFSVFGHLDYIARYGSYPDISLKFEDFKNVLMRLISTAIKRDKGFEINTAYLRRNNFSLQFYKDFFKAYKEAGGEIVTVGSDSHDNNTFRLNFDLAGEILDFAGFNYISSFEKMKPKKVFLF